MMKRLLMGVALLAAAGGCSDSTGPEAAGAQVSLSVMLPGSGPTAGGLFAGGELTLDDGVHTLVIKSAEVVLREIEFERAGELTGCDEDEGEIDGSDDDACEEFETDPMLLALPLDGSVLAQREVQVEPGLYDEIEFDLHKVGDDLADLQFLSANPAFDGISVRVVYSWDGSEDRTFTSDVNAEQENEFATPIEIMSGGTYNVTISVDVDSWFFDGITLTDPGTALHGGANEQLVENRIESSFEGFEDDDRDGVPHSEDDDESDSSAA